MAKGKSNFLYYIFVILSILVAGVGIASIALPAFEATYTIPLIKKDLVASSNLSSFIFGTGELGYSFNGGEPTNTTLTGGLSYLALAGFIGLALGLLLLIILLFKKSKGLALLAALLLIAGGVCVFFFKEMGTNITVQAGEYIKFEDAAFTDFWKVFGADNIKYGIGTIVFGAAGCLSGVTTLIAAIVKK